MIKFSKDSVVLRFQKNLLAYDIDTEKEKAIVENKKEILDLNKSQLRIGIDSKGNTFGDYISASYAEFKKSLNSYFARFPTPDLFLTGRLQNEMDLELRGGDVAIFSRDPDANKKTSGRFSEAFGINRNIQPVVERRTTDTFFKNTYDKLFK